MGCCSGFVKNLDLVVPGLSDNTADVERFKSVLARELGSHEIKLPLSLMADLPLKIRRFNHRVKCVVFKESSLWRVVAIKDAMDGQVLMGVAMDMGTTRVVIEILNLETGEVLGHREFDNPQIVMAPDVLARIHHASTGNGQGLKDLQQLIIQGLNSNLTSLCQDCGLEMSNIHLIFGAGNTAMTHIFLGIDPSFIIREPYIPCVNSPESVAAKELALKINPLARIYLFPNIGSYFGGDLISGIYYAGVHKKESPCLMVDVGTNAEVVVGGRDWLIACAGAAGPALEGGVSKMGMAAGPGVIDSISIDPVTCEIRVHTIGDKPAMGICGSGMLDLAAQLFLSGMVDIRGKFIQERCGKRLINDRGIDSFVVVSGLESGTGKDILLTQVDMNSLTSSKAAMYSILEVLVQQTAGIGFSDLDVFYVAGTFGSFINPESAISIGMLPDLPLDKFKVLGNSSLAGAAKLLMDSKAFGEIEQIRNGITYIELNVNQEFMNIFSGAKFYPHTDLKKFPSVKPYSPNGRFVCHDKR